jgi:Homeodomain-like domain
MVEFLINLLLVARSKLKSRARLEAENLVLRQQVIVLSRKSGSRVWLRNIDRLIFVWIYRLFPSILNAITVVKPETVIRWHRRGFRAYWRWKSRRRGGRPRIDREIRDLIRRMSRENPLWGAPRIHGELLMLGIEVAESTVARYLTKRQGPPSQVGKHSCAITLMALLRLIFSWCERSRSSCSTAWSFFATPEGDW